MHVCIALQWQQEGPTASQRTGTRLITSRVIVMSGFGPSKPSPKPATTGEALARNMQTKYEQLRREGGTTAQVHARVRGADRWFVVGYVRIANRCARPYVLLLATKYSHNLSGRVWRLDRVLSVARHPSF